MKSKGNKRGESKSGKGKTLKKYFIPHKQNDHKPHILRARSVVFVLVIAVAIEALFIFGSSYLEPQSHLFGAIFANALVDGANSNRTANGVLALQESPLLDAAAQEKANDMVAKNYFAHTSPSGTTPWFWFQNVGYNFIYAGENLAVNFSDSLDVTNAWMNSPEHRANILDPNFTQIGMATAQGTFNGHPAVYVVELFGTPATGQGSFDIVNTAGAAGAPAPTQAATPVTTPTVPSGAGSAAGGKIAKIKPAKTATTSAPIAVATPAVNSANGALTTLASSASQNANSAQSFTEVKGASATAEVANVAPQADSQNDQQNNIQNNSQSNPVQEAAANPRSLANIIYLTIIAIFGVALILNIFIKVRIQHPSLIFGGALVVLIAGLFIVLNQHMLISAAIL